MYRVYPVDINTNSSGDGSAYTPAIVGAFESVGIVFTGAGSSTTVDIDEVLDLTSPTLGQKLLDKGAGNTNVTLYPRAAAQDNTGSAVTFDGTNEIYTRVASPGRSWKITLASSGGALTPAARVYLVVEE